MATRPRLALVNQETWDFLDPVVPHLSRVFDVDAFQPRHVHLPLLSARLDRWLLRHDLRRLLRRREVVFFEWASALLALGARLPRSAAVVTRLHRYELAAWADRIDWTGVDRIVVVSRAKQRAFAARFPAHASKVVVVYPGVSLERFAPVDRPFTGVIGTLCHLTPRKRVYDLVLTFAELVRDGADLRLHIGGGMVPPYRDYDEALRRIVAELGLGDRVTFWGPVTDTPAWYRQIDVFVSNSHDEGLQVAAIEALASGCYCLVHQWDGAEELVPREQRFFTSRELGQKILVHAERSQAQRAALRDQARAIAVARFDLAQTGPELAAVLLDACGRGPADG